MFGLSGGLVRPLALGLRERKNPASLQAFAFDYKTGKGLIFCFGKGRFAKLGWLPGGKVEIAENRNKAADS